MSQVRSVFVFACSLLAISAAGNAQLQVSGPTPATAPDGGFIVTFRPGTPAAARAAALQRAGAAVQRNFQVIDGSAVRIPNANVLATLQADMSVTGIVPDHTVYAFQTQVTVPLAKATTTASAPTSTEVLPINVKRVGDSYSGSDGAGIGVVVADTGIDRNHPDLAVSLPFVDAFGGSCLDGHGHGTHVAGIVAALKNTRDIRGVAPAATLYCGKALNDQGSGNDSTIIAVLDWVFLMHKALPVPIRVVNLSLGRAKQPSDTNGPLHLAIQRLYAANIIVVAAAGNDAKKEVKDMVPAGFPEVLAVASTTAKDGVNSCRSFPGKILADTASFFTTDGRLTSNIGVTISAPGEEQENISAGCMVFTHGALSLKKGGGTTRMSGTSMASPLVAGIAARVLQKGLASTPEGVRSYLRSTAQRFGAAPLNSPTSGYSFDQEREGIAKAP